MKKPLAFLNLVAFAISGCVSTGADVYDSSELDISQDTKTVTILDVQSIRINVKDAGVGAAIGGGIGAVVGGLLGALAGKNDNKNEQNKSIATGVATGAVLGGATGAATKQKTIEGVYITYQEGRKRPQTLRQAGRICQFREKETALLVLTRSGQRIQPNGSCTKSTPPAL